MDNNIKLKVNLYKHTNTMGEEQETKWYGNVVRTATYDMAALSRHIAQHGSIYTQDVIYGVLRKLGNCIPELVAQGIATKLEGLGTFYPMVKTTGADKASEFTVANVKQVIMQFTADRNTQEDVSNLTDKANVEINDVKVLLGTKVIDGEERKIYDHIKVANYVKLSEDGGSDDDPDPEPDPEPEPEP